MNEKKYRLIRDHHYRSVTSDKGEAKLVRFNRGMVLVPLDHELKNFPQNWEGPLSDDVEVSDPLTWGREKSMQEQRPAISAAPGTDEERAAEALKSPNWIDTVRQADIKFCDLLADAEGDRPNGPRKKVIEALDRRRKALLDTVKVE